MDSILLQKQVRDNAKDLQEFCKELKEWGDDMKKNDESLKRSTDSTVNNETSVPRNKVSKIESKKIEINESKPVVRKSKRIKAHDYAAWEKFDADAYCARLEKESEDENSSPESDLSDEIDENALEMANSEKEKGNSFVKKQQWSQAIDCYTRAIECYAYDPIYYANRALCYLKKEMYRNAESDSTTALQLDKTYVKAYQRRAAAREKLNQMSEAHSDLLKVLELEPKNKESKVALSRIEKNLESVEEVKSETAEDQRPVSKFTLSRQKHKDTIIERQVKKGSTEKQASPLNEHVIERKLSSGPNSSNRKLTTEVLNPGKQIPSSSLDLINSKSKSIEGKSSVLKIDDDLLLSRHNIDDIQLFQSIHKPLRTRSKKPLKRIQIVDVDLETEKVYLHTQSNIKESNDSLETAKHESIRSEINITEGNAIKNNDIPDTEKVNFEKIIPKDHALEKSEMNKFDESKEDNVKDNPRSFELLDLPIPKTAVQFYNGWKSLKSSKLWQKMYLLRISPTDLPVIFKESLESKVFSEIMETISDDVNKNNICLCDYLLALAQVKRFGALVMFMSSKDKKCVLNIIESLKQDNRYTNTYVDNLVKLYEL